VALFYSFDPHSIALEHTLIKANGRRGRADMLLHYPDSDLRLMLFEIKNTDWTKLDESGTMARNLGRHRRQVWEYLDGQIHFREAPSTQVDLSEVHRCAAVIYPRTPGNPDLVARVESHLGEWGIMVSWFDEPPIPSTAPWAKRAWRYQQAGVLDLLVDLHRLTRHTRFGSAEEAVLTAEAVLAKLHGGFDPLRILEEAKRRISKSARRLTVRETL